MSPQPFRALAVALSEGGHPSHGARLEEVLAGAFTTSSELIGELGAAVAAVGRECGSLSPTQQRLVDRCLGELRKTGSIR